MTVHDSPNINEIEKLLYPETCSPFSRKLTSITLFHAECIMTQVVMRELITLEKNGSEFKGVLKRAIEDHLETKNDLGENGTSYSKITNERVYASYFQIFEEFIYDTLTFLYKFFPKFLISETANESKIATFYDEIFENTDIKFVQDRVIERKVIYDLIQGNNIITTLNKFKSIFGIDLKLSDKDIKELFVLSKNRNLLIHNNGIVNGIYLSEMKKMNIQCKFTIGESIANSIEEEIKPTMSLVYKCGLKIYDSINSQIKQIVKYYRKKYS